MELRDTTLALDIARKAAERFEVETTKQYLGWALFRAGLWEECLETLAPQDSEACITKISRTNSSIIAMSLWHLGQKEDAVSWLGTEHDRELAEYIQKCEEKAKVGSIDFPTPAMLQRLETEAKELFGSNPGNLDEANAKCAKIKDSDGLESCQ